MDVVRAVNDWNFILPAGDVRIGSLDYNIYSNASCCDTNEHRIISAKNRGQKSVFVADVGVAKDAAANAILYCPSRWAEIRLCSPFCKQGGDANTIAVVDGIKEAINEPGGYSEAAGHQALSFLTSPLFVKKAI